MKRLLLVDDQPGDLRIAADAARSLGVFEVEAKMTVARARCFLEKGLEGETPLPDGIVLDLDLGLESGHELLRLWHSTPRLAGIPMIVWSIMEDQRRICSLFKVNEFVDKGEGVGAIRDALRRIAG